jgi:hypothetical protein
MSPAGNPYYNVTGEHLMTTIKVKQIYLAGY